MRPIHSGCRKTIARILGLIIYVLSQGIAFQEATAGEEAASTASVGTQGQVVSWSMLAQRNKQGIRSQMPPLPARRLSDIEAQTFDDIKKRRIARHFRADIESESQPVQQADKAVGFPVAAAPAKQRDFEGIDNSGQLDGFLHRPPDPIIAAGPDHVATVVNSEFTVYTKSGTKVQESSLSDWFDNVCSGCSPFDPRIVYDPVEDRWILVALKGTDPSTSQYLLSVSQTSDPTGSWWNWALDGSLLFGSEDTWADYPDLGFDGIASGSGGAIYLVSNQFTASDSFRTSMLNILPKSNLYTGAAFEYWRAWDRKNSDGSQAFTLRAAQTYGNPGHQYLINSRSGSNYVTIWRVNPTYPPTAVDWTLQTTQSISTYNIPPDAEQAGCSDLLSTIDNRIYNAVWRNNRLYAAFTEAHDWGEGGGEVSAIRYLKINTLTNSTEINIRFGADGFYYFFPAIATDSSENIIFVFARSSSSEFGSIRYTGQKTTDSETQQSAQLKAGVECITGDRWGDYFGASVDPSDETKVWVYGEWAADLAGVSSIWDWGTWIGQITFDTTTLTVAKDGGGSGTVTSSPSGIDCGSDCSESYADGTSVTLTATPAAGSVFGRWSGGGCTGTGTCTVTADSDKTVTATFVLPLAIASPLDDGEVNLFYDEALISGGLPPYTTTLKGALPAGLSIDSSDGTLSGTPTLGKKNNVTVTVTDQLGTTVTKKVTVNLLKAVTISSKSLKKGKIGKAYSSALKAKGGKVAYTWSLVSGTLPAGLSLSSTGVISGTPTAAGSSNLTFEVEDAMGGTAQKSLTLTIT